MLALPAGDMDGAARGVASAPPEPDDVAWPVVMPPRNVDDNEGEDDVDEGAVGLG